MAVLYTQLCKVPKKNLAISSQKLVCIDFRKSLTVFLFLGLTNFLPYFLCVLVQLPKYTILNFFLPA